MQWIDHIWLGLLSRNYWSSSDHDLMASIWEQAISILLGNSNSGRSYHNTAVQICMSKMSIIRGSLTFAVLQRRPKIAYDWLLLQWFFFPLSLSWSSQGEYSCAKIFLQSLNKSNPKSWNLPLFWLRLIICRNSSPLTTFYPNYWKTYFCRIILQRKSECELHCDKNSDRQSRCGPLMTHLILRSEWKCYQNDICQG